MTTSINRLGGDGILTDEDLKDFSKAETRIIRLMEDGQWYGAERIIYYSQQREGLRRLRNLRSRGFVVERRRANGSNREFLYRLTQAAPDAQTELPL